VIGWLRQHPDCADLRRLFGELVRQAFAERGMTKPIPDDLEELEEMRTNLATIGKYWKQQAFAEGRAEGKAEGRAEGRPEALVCLLAERFGKVRPPLRRRIREADLATIDCWFKRAIAAPDLPSIFTQPH
jgi:hypothetical protein